MHSQRTAERQTPQGECMIYMLDTDIDILIAAAALSTGAILVSHNKKHFSKIKGIKVEDWC